ncbi:Trm112 family protein [Chloroflexus sp.]|uniref:Trm112 family protein n=1 Tax=Chloroflexus sp. TaxID=1904827 RepID=UPI003D120157
MKNVLRILGIAAVVGLAIAIFRAVRQYQEDSVFDLTPATNSNTGNTGNTTQRGSISPDLLSMLADPGDKGPVELMVDANGKEWLVNRRNGYRYPIEDGIPIMLLEEGEKNKDESLIQK